MRDATETEIKLVATPAMLGALRGHAALAGPDSVAAFAITYFDTVTGRLRSAGATLRIRQGPNGRGQTLKLARRGGAAVGRNEWTVTLPGEALDLSLFPATAQARLHRLDPGGEMKPMAISRMERTTRRIAAGGSAIEVAFDSCVIEAGERNQKISELELELVEGKLADVIALALRLPLGNELHWSLTSKAARSLALAFDGPKKSIQAEPNRFAGDCSAAQGFRTIAWACLAHFLHNYRSIIDSGDVGAVHQSRVAVRRFRAACGLFRNVIADDPARELRVELKAVATALGDLRDLDVLIARVAAAAKSGGQDNGELVAHLERRRATRLGPVRELLSGATLQELLFGLAGWIEAGGWHAGKAGGEPLRSFAARALAKRRRRLRCGRESVSAMPIEKRHELRIEVKKLRYAAEFFAPLYRDGAPAKSQRRFAKALARLQDSLGALNDLAVASSRAGNLFSDLDPIVAAGMEVRLTNLLAGEGRQVKPLIKSADKAYARIVEAPAFWKAARGSAR